MDLTLYHMHFEPIGLRGDCPEDQSLLDVARQLGVGLVNLCNGKGTCRRCKVQVLTGRVSEPTPTEVRSPAGSLQSEGLLCERTPERRRKHGCRGGNPEVNLWFESAKHCGLISTKRVALKTGSANSAEGRSTYGEVESSAR